MRTAERVVGYRAFYTVVKLYHIFGAYNSEQTTVNCLSRGERYRYGFNGKEKIDERYGIEGTAYDYGFRMYDPGISRFMSVDPITKSYPELTPYQFASNIPIWAIDLDGLEAYFTTDGKFDRWGKEKGPNVPAIVIKDAGNVQGITLKL